MVGPRQLHTNVVELRYVVRVVNLVHVRNEDSPHPVARYQLVRCEWLHYLLKAPRATRVPTEEQPLIICVPDAVMLYNLH